MFERSKGSGDYLRQIRNNAEEKTEIIEAALDAGTLPRTEEGKIRIAELGTGGGESLRALKTKLASANDVELIAVDIIPDLAASLKKELDVLAVGAEANHLPFASESLSAVNASALMHEVNSYGFKDDAGTMRYGIEAVRAAFSEFNRVLMPEGVVAYRDMLAPLENMQEPKTVTYHRKSWTSFADWFLKDFLKTEPLVYDASSVKAKEKGGNFELDAPIGLQRELQRHYLMLRDYIRTVKAEEFGITTARSDWLDKDAGLKTVTFLADARVASVVDLSSFEMHESAEGNVYRADSDRFDAMYDEMMEFYWQQLKNGAEGGSDFGKIIDAWKMREGTEHYLYGNIGDMLRIAVDASIGAGGSSVLLPEFPEDIVVVPRNYYNRYLAQVADKPEADGKQMIAFKKMPRERGIVAFGRLAESKRGMVDPSVLEMLRSKLEA